MLPATVHYLDHAATTPVLPAVLDVLTATMRGPWGATTGARIPLPHVGNPSSLHIHGRAARQLVEESREQIGQVLGVDPSEIIFTSGGTEADNLAIKGTYTARRQQDSRRDRIVVSGIEHHAVLDAVEYLVASAGARVTWIEPDPQGRITVEAVRAAVEADGGVGTVALVSVMWANNEVGTIQPIPQIAALTGEHGIPLHTDAVQAWGQVPVDLEGVQLAALAGHKIGGPPGIGVLVARRDQNPVPLLHGGGQERSLRSGTVNVAGAAGLAAAIGQVVREQEEHARELVVLRDDLIRRALALGDGVGELISVSGAWTPGDMQQRLPSNVHLRVEGCDGDSLLYLLDAAGISCSTGSACTAGVPRPSHVLLAMGLPEASAKGALRLTLGRGSSQADVDAVLAALPEAITRARAAAGALADSGSPVSVGGGR